MKNKINIAAVVQKLDFSDNCFYMTKEFNKALEITDLMISASLFFSTPTSEPLPVRSCFSHQFSHYLASYSGMAIATNIKDTDSILKIAGGADVYLYLWNLPWNYRSIDFESSVKVMRNPRVNLIARSKSHSQAIENFCNKKPVAIIDNWDIEKLSELYRNS